MTKGVRVERNEGFYLMVSRYGVSTWGSTSISSTDPRERVRGDFLGDGICKTENLGHGSQTIALDSWAVSKFLTHVAEGSYR